MPKYLVLANYNTEGVNGILDKGGTSRVQALEALCESVGGSLESFYFAFGDTDAYVTADLPDNATAAALSMTAAASGVVDVTTVALLTPEEIDAAGQITVEYRPPGS